MIKFEEKHIETLEHFISKRKYPQTFVLNPIWLVKGPYFIKQHDETFWTIFKQAQMYGKQIVYGLGPPICVEETSDLTCRNRREFLAFNAMKRQYDFQLTDLDLRYLKVPDSVKKEKVFTEFLYHNPRYGDLPGKEFLRWRQALNKVQSDYKLEVYHNKFPFWLQGQMLQLVKGWKDHRSKYVGKYTDWYVQNFKKLKDVAVVCIFNRHGNQLVSFSISQNINGYIYFLDEKANRNIPPLRNGVRVHHIETLRHWERVLGISDFYMNSGIGSERYSNDKGKEFDLDEAKRALKPIQEVNIYKVRAHA